MQLVNRFIQILVSIVKRGIAPHQQLMSNRLKRLWQSTARFLMACTICHAMPVWSASTPVTPEGFEYSTFVGYQAWFNVPNDATGRGWFHWGTDPLNAQSMVIDMWPDVSEYPAAALQNTGFTLGSGLPGSAYSAFNDGVIDTHFRWMQQYDIAGVFLQWFVVDDPNYRLQISKKVQSSAEKYGRKLVIMFDISGTQPPSDCGTGAALAQCLKSRWISAVDNGITSSPNYQQYKNKPLVGLWGLGFNANNHFTASDALTFINWLHNDAPVKYQANIMGGVSTGWRTNSADAIQTDGLWGSVYSSLDIISPWTVGRYADDASASNFIQSIIRDDLDVIRQRNQRYLPVVFPGFSWANLMRGKPNSTPNLIPRRGGEFLWTQSREYAALGVTSYYVAMFDEIDEGTAIYKTAPNASFAPREFYTVTLDADGISLPNDWYLRVNQIIVNAVKQPGYSGFLTPKLPISVTAGALAMSAGTLRSGGPFSLAYQTDGNLVIYDSSFTPLWASNTAGRACSPATCIAAFQTDGNLVLYQDGVAYWSTQTIAPGGTLLISSAPPFITVVRQDGTPILSIP